MRPNISHFVGLFLQLETTLFLKWKKSPPRAVIPTYFRHSPISAVIPDARCCFGGVSGILIP